jgi:hypothetical protein
MSQENIQFKKMSQENIQFKTHLDKNNQMNQRKMTKNNEMHFKNLYLKQKNKVELLEKVNSQLKFQLKNNKNERDAIDKQNNLQVQLGNLINLKCYN